MTRIETEAYVVTPPVGAAGPMVFASPHSGDRYPGDMGARVDLTPASLRSAEDALVDRLIAPAAEAGVTVLSARVGRAYVDLNRGADELDPALIEGTAAAHGGPRAAAGYGVAARLAGDGAPLYDRRLSLAEVEGRLARVHAPYHAALDALMQAARDQHGAAVLVDWHSMPARAAGGGGRATRPVDVVLGDRHGASCAGELTRCLRRLFEAEGLRVALNRPYAGGWCTRFWGRPDEGFHAVQVELNRALYLDEATLEPLEGYARCAGIVRRVIARLAAEDWARLAR